MNEKMTLEILGNTYEVSFPDTGQLFDINALKLAVTNKMYESLKYSVEPAFVQEAFQADMIATFNTLIPQLKKDLNVDSLFKLNAIQIDELMQVYEEQFLPWFEEKRDAQNKAIAESRANRAAKKN